MEIDTLKIKQKIPEYVYHVAEILHENNYKAYLVGGAVRDLLIDKKPKDYDIATDALPLQMEKIFPRCVTTNARFGTILVIMEDNNMERFDVEVTTFRKEENYYSGRWPASVEFTSKINEDLSRRDFTINAMALDLVKLSDVTINDEELLIDPYNGLDDLKARLVKAVRDPLDRFSEDGLRAFRACRLASEYQFSLDKDTFEAIKASLNVAKMISIERIRDEFTKLIYRSPKPSRGINLLNESGLLQIFLPELIDCIGIRQPEYHDDDVYDHSLKVLDLAEDSVKLAGLFHDIGKAKTMTKDEDGSVHFYGHDQVGVEIVNEVMNRLKFPKYEIKRITNLIKYHMFYYPSADWRNEKDLDQINEDISKKVGGWTEAAIRRFIKNVGEENLDDLFKLRIADATSNSRSQFNDIEIIALQKRISDVKAKDMVLKVEDLQIDGFDLIKIGIKPGPEIGLVLNGLLNLVIEDPKLNNKTILLSESKNLLKNIREKNKS